MSSCIVGHGKAIMKPERCHGKWEIGSMDPRKNRDLSREDTARLESLGINIAKSVGSKGDEHGQLFGAWE